MNRQTKNEKLKLNQLPNGQYAPRNLYENSNHNENSSMKTQNSKWHGNNAIMGDDECLRQGLYLQAQERAW